MSNTNCLLENILNTNSRFKITVEPKIQGNSLSPSGISDLCGTVAGMVTPKGSMSTEGETLQVSVLPIYTCNARVWR